MTNRTIYACASGPGPSAIAVYRVSGADSDAVLAALAPGRPPTPRRAVLRGLRHPESGERVDEGLVILFEEGASYTGERSFEVHVHGGVAVRRALEDALTAAGAQLAQPGEFSRRALVNGRFDVAQAEAIASLIAAETTSERLQALEVLDGAVGRQATAWRTQIIDAAALIETGIDFVDERLEASIIEEARAKVAGLLDSMGDVSIDRPSISSADTPIVALVGAPNAGKSSLLNAIVERDAAIVSSIAGTTRDVVTSVIRIDGVAMRVVDTAGVRAASEEIERIGVARAIEHAERAELRIMVVSSDTGGPSSEIEALLKEGDAVFWTKADDCAPTPQELATVAGWPAFVVSSNDGSAAQAFAEVVQSARPSRPTGVSVIGDSARRAALIAAASEHVAAALEAIASDRLEAAIEELRMAAEQVTALVGSVDHEDVLDALFSKFCIGK